MLSQPPRVEHASSGALRQVAVGLPLPPLKFWRAWSNDRPPARLRCLLALLRKVLPQAIRTIDRAKRFGYRRPCSPSDHLDNSSGSANSSCSKIFDFASGALALELAQPPRVVQALSSSCFCSTLSVALLRKLSRRYAPTNRPPARLWPATLRGPEHLPPARSVGRSSVVSQYSRR